MKNKRITAIISFQAIKHKLFYKNIKEKTHKSKKQSRAEQGKTRANTDSNTNKN